VLNVKYSTIASLIKGSCTAKAGNELLVDEKDQCSGYLLWSKISSACHWLADRGFKKGDVVAFCCASSIAHAVIFLACLVSGVVPCCLHIRETKKRNRENIKFISAKAIFVDPDIENQVKSLIKDDCVFVLPTKFKDIKAPEEVEITVNPDDLALILISSGTTGEPKCISHTQKTLAATAEYGPYNYGVSTEEDSTIVIMAPSFAAWIHTVLPFIFIKGRIVFRNSFDPVSFLQTLENEKITLAPLVPTIWRMVLTANPEHYDLSNLKSIFFSGEPGSDNLVEELQQKIGFNVITSYLASEGGCASGVVADANILSVKGQAASTGYPIKDAEIRIIDPGGSFTENLPVGEIGEIAMKSPSVAAGYFGNSLLSKEKFLGGWWRSGDLGFIDNRGLLFVKGRLDNRINTGGVKVFAEEVESCLLKHPKVNSAAVVGITDKKWGQKVVAHVVSNDPDLVDSEILNFCYENELLPRTHLPKEIYFHESLPVGPTGKLFRRGLYDRGFV